MVIHDNPNVGHVMGVEALSELKNPGEVEGVPDGSRDIVEDTIDDFKIEATILLDVQVEHVVEMDVTTESDMIPASNEIHVDVNVNEYQLGLIEIALDEDFSFDLGIE
ncbi:hypothetical protein LIER_20840 [Lithospermum erythrorhizon]|uniref:Uncharacterized protein n=1 Tax=Lithospermum erythrorhizon TaxID=34254 RepID=A0AAV3QN08_LITER